MKPKTFKDYYDLLLAGNGKKKKAKIIRMPEIISEAVSLQKLSRGSYISAITKKAFNSAQDILERIKFRKKTQNTLAFAVSSSKEKKNYIVKVAFEDKIPNTLKKLYTTNCLLHCNCGAFRNQGIQYKLTTIDGALVPENTPDEVWGPRHNNRNYVCKHIYAILTKIKNSKLKSTKTFLNSLKGKTK
jgi:hypothetical protein